MSGRRMSGTSRRIPRLFWNCNYPSKNEGEEGKTARPRLSLELGTRRPATE